MFCGVICNILTLQQKLTLWAAVLTRFNLENIFFKPLHRWQFSIRRSLIWKSGLHWRWNQLWFNANGKTQLMWHSQKLWGGQTFCQILLWLYFFVCDILPIVEPNMKYDVWCRQKPWSSAWMALLSSTLFVQSAWGCISTCVHFLGGTKHMRLIRLCSEEHEAAWTWSCML